jgi:hypothetical protein
MTNYQKVQCIQGLINDLEEQFYFHLSNKVKIDKGEELTQEDIEGLCKISFEAFKEIIDK